MNNKGFTLVELLATLVILSIIMIVAVPSTISILEKNKKAAMISDAKRMVTLAESQIRNNDAIDTTYGGFIVFKLSYLDDGSFEKDPDNMTYDPEKSFVVVHKNGNVTNFQFDYYVQISGGKRGIDLTDAKGLDAESVVTETTGNDHTNAIKTLFNNSNPNITYPAQ